MDANSVLARTAKGIVQQATEGGDLNYDAVRLRVAMRAAQLTTASGASTGVCATLRALR